MKKAGILILTIIMLFCFAACSEKEDNIGDYEQDNGETSSFVEEEVPNQVLDRDYIQKVDQGLIDPVYCLDLSEYEDHGEWSSERMWVEKEESSWDAVKTYYGYIDTKGNVVGQWHEKGGIYYNDKEGLEDFVNDVEVISPWKKPADFNGEYATISCGDCTEVIDLNGNTVAKYVYSINEAKILNCEDGTQIHLFNSGEDTATPLRMLKITDGKVMDAIISDDLYIPTYFRLSKDKITYCHYNTVLETSEFCAIDLDGNMVIKGSTEYEAVSFHVTEGEIEEALLIFIGVDGGEWCVTVDTKGNWLCDPVRY